MSRQLRIEYPDAWYHVMNRGRRREETFKDKTDYKQFIEILKETSQVYKFRVASYCLMSNHYHLLVQTPKANLSRCMRHVDGVYTQRFNRRYDIDGPLFRGRYKSTIVEADNYLLPLIRYIHRNPVRAGLVKNPKDYEWSSHRVYLTKTKPDTWIYKDFILSILSNNPAGSLRAYKRLISLPDGGNTFGILENDKWPSFLGSKDFICWIKDKYHLSKRDDEVPQSKALTPDMQLIQDVVAKFYGIQIEELLSSRRGTLNEPRNIAIYLTRHLRGDSLKEIARDFRINKYSSVSSVIERTKREINKNLNLNKIIDKIQFQITKSQKQT
jgi:putative transposase